MALSIIPEAWVAREPPAIAADLVLANHGMVVLAGKVSSGAEIYAGSAAEGIRFFTGLLYGSAIAVASWLTVGGAAWWVTR